MTATNITELKPNQIFVFGSNLNGWHGGGAARQAQDKFGAMDGQSKGLRGQSYAIPTLGHDMEKLLLETIKVHLIDLAEDALRWPEKEFLLTPIGTGIAGFSLQETEKTRNKTAVNFKKNGFIKKFL